MLFVSVQRHVVRLMSAIHLSEHFEGDASVGLRPTNVHKDEQEDLSSAPGKIFWKIKIINSFLKRDVSQRTIGSQRQWVPGSGREGGLYMQTNNSAESLIKTAHINSNTSTPCHCALNHI